MIISTCCRYIFARFLHTSTPYQVQFNTVKTSHFLSACSFAPTHYLFVVDATIYMKCEQNLTQNHHQSVPYCCWFDTVNRNRINTHTEAYKMLLLLLFHHIWCVAQEEINPILTYQCSDTSLLFSSTLSSTYRKFYKKCIHQQLLIKPKCTHTRSRSTSDIQIIAALYLNGPFK